ncbi:MAG: extracellular solute-binding protein [Paraglaciecola sp.]|nr:extracellular solute-binding protein [Paraglaciecola sp.]NCT48657.1 extracellular solute-binding protein [Paraglaciecola sp.]
MIKHERSARWCYPLFISAWLLLIFAPSCYADITLRFAVNPSSVAQQEIYHILAGQFEKANPDINIQVDSRSLEEHKLMIQKFVQKGESVADVMTGYAGAQVTSLAKASLLLPLNELWVKHKLESQFNPASRLAVSYDQKIVALPLNYYQWGIYYKKSVFSKAGISVPQTWSELLQVISVLRKNNIVPFTLSGGSNWSLAAWFDYLNLRINGLDFHLKLLAGKHAFTDKRVNKVFEYWQQLLAIGAFEQQQVSLTWQESLPFLYRNHVAMTLMGNFFVAHIPAEQKKDFGFFAFPTIHETMPRYEDVPIDVVFIHRHTAQIDAAQRFVAFLSQPETQSLFSNYVGKISPNIYASQNDKDFIYEGREHINSAAGLAQFFDRDTETAFSLAAQKVFYQFVSQPDTLPAVIGQLEALRAQYLIVQPAADPTP